MITDALHFIINSLSDLRLSSNTILMHFNMIFVAFLWNRAESLSAAVMMYSEVK